MGISETKKAARRIFSYFPSFPAAENFSPIFIANPIYTYLLRLSTDLKVFTAGAICVKIIGNN